jgi:hypothetical protein
MAALLARGAQSGWKVGGMVKMWGNLKSAALKAVPPVSAASQGEALNNLFTWIKRGESANIPGWPAFLAQGATGGLEGKTTGFYHVLDHLNSLGWRNIVELERGMGRVREVTLRSGLVVQRYERYIDVVLLENGVEVLRELKNLRNSSPFNFGAQVAKDIELAMREAGAGGLRLNETVLRERLSRLQYYLRGSEAEMAAVRRGLERKLRRELGTGFEDLWTLVKIRTEAKRLPVP